MFDISAKHKNAAKNFRSKPAIIFYHPSSRNALVHDAENLKIFVVCHGIILAVVHGQEIFCSIYVQLGVVNSGHPANWPANYIWFVSFGISICFINAKACIDKGTKSDYHA